MQENQKSSELLSPKEFIYERDKQIIEEQKAREAPKLPLKPDTVKRILERQRITRTVNKNAPH